MLNCRDGFAVLSLDYLLGENDPEAWKGILLAYLGWLDEKQGELSLEGPKVIDYTPIKIHPASFRAMTLSARPAVFAIEHLSMHFQNAVACALAYRSVGSSLLREQRFYLCSGQWSYRLSAEGARFLRGTHCVALPPDRHHNHHGEACELQTVKFVPKDASSALSAYLFTIDQVPGKKFVSKAINF